MEKYFLMAIEGGSAEAVNNLGFYYKNQFKLQTLHSATGGVVYFWFFIPTLPL